MKTYNGNRQQERRRKRIFTPALYFLAELTLAWIILSVINISFNVQVWANWSYFVLFAIFLYSAYKTQAVYQRQKHLKRA